MTEELLDEELVRRAQAGQPRAFDLLIMRHQSKVVQLVARFVGEGDAPDVAQEAFIKAYRALPKFKGDSAFYTWLYRIAINTAKNHLAAQGRRAGQGAVDVREAERVDAPPELRETATPERLVLRDEVQQVVLEALEALPEDLRTAISLRELEGMSYEDIALAMDCPIGTVRSRIFRAREAINRRLEPLLG